MSNHCDSSMPSPLTIVVNTCDSYADVLSLFFAAFQEYWPSCPYPVVINSESKKYTCYAAQTHIYGPPGAKDRWGDRLITTLNSIDTEFVLMLYDDFVLEERVYDSRIAEAIDFLSLIKNAAVAYLINTSLKTKSEVTHSRFARVHDTADYRLNSSPAIWRRELLIGYTGVIDNPWAWEVFGSYRTYGDGKAFYTLRQGEEDIYKFNRSKGGAIYRGKWVREVVAGKFEKYHLGIDEAVRGFSADNIYEARSWMWKAKFLVLGFRMVGIKSTLFVFSYFRIKLNSVIKAILASAITKG